MLLSVYFALLAVAGLFTYLAFRMEDWRALPLYFLAGLMFLVVGWNSGNIESVVVYQSSDYLRTFRYPALVILHSLIGAVFMVFSIFGTFDYVKSNVEGLNNG